MESTEKNQSQQQFSLKGIRGVLVLFFAFITVLLLIEVSLRIFTHYRFGVPLLDIRPYLYDKELFWVANPGYKGPISGCRKVEINSRGFRGYDLVAQDSSKRAILTFGDSNTFGYRIETSDSLYPALMERNLNSREEIDDFIVYNYGMNGYSSYQGKILLRKNFDIYKPVLITIYYGWNDLWKSPLEDKNATGHEKLLSKPGQGGNVMIIYSLKKIIKTFYRRQLKRGSQYSGKYSSRVSLEDYKANIKTMIKYSFERNCRIILLTYPSDKENKIFRDSIKPYNNVIKQITDEYDMLLLDAEAVIDDYPRETVFLDPNNDCVHLSVYGHIVLADTLAGMIAVLEL